MTDKEAFKAGFLEKCAVDGLSPDATLARIRHARLTYEIAVMEKEGAIAAPNPLSVAGDAVTGGWKALWPLLMAAPPVAGMMAGAGLAKMKNQDYDEDEARAQEELAEYHRALKEMQRIRAGQKLEIGAG